MQDRRITIKDMWQVLFKREFYLDMAVFVFVCVPITLAILFCSIRLDKHFGIQPFISIPYNIIFFLLFSVSGTVIIWRAYTYLVIIGEGGPCPQLGGTKKIVTSGPYSLVRHPSVIGKLLGIIGLACLSNSVFFTFVVIPLLFTGSALYNKFVQEKGCTDRFGKEYIEYRKTVPMFIPKLKRVKSK